MSIVVSILHPPHPIPILYPIRVVVAFPLSAHKESERVRKALLSRGKKYTSLNKSHYRKYSGVPLPVEEVLDILGNGIQYGQTRHRIMVDTHEYNKTYRPCALNFLGDELIDVGSFEFPNLSDEHLLMCFDRVPAFSLTTKTWGYFEVDRIEEIEFDNRAFHHLALPDAKKDLIAALVRAGSGAASGFDDMIEGKGKGAIFLLHGPPGVGKTFTVESISEYMKRPLYTVHCADLGWQTRDMEARIAAAFSLATKWNAIVLIDEADVFMTERGLNIMRNELVSVLLRVLEYFQGILFLTTNRVTSIDEAFRSRIHCSLAYPNLSRETRSQLWLLFISRGPTRQTPEWANEAFIADVSRYVMNGRQIKNSVRVAYALAHDKNRALLPSDILTILQVNECLQDDCDV